MEPDAIAITLSAHRANGVRCQRRRVASENAHVATDGAGASIWEHMIHSLLSGYGGEGVGATDPARPASRRPLYVPTPHIQVEVIERLSATAVAVLWQDSTRCRYVDQVWVRCGARAKGRCAVSGAVIRRADPIYKPRSRSVAPVNAGVMILASVIEQMPSRGIEGGLR